jgi:hypothetical protein
MHQMKLKVYFDKDNVKWWLNELRPIDNFEWSTFLLWLPGFYKLEDRRWEEPSGSYLVPLDTNIFKLLLMPLKIVLIPLSTVLFGIIWSAVMLFNLVASIKIRRDDNACERSCIRQNSGIREYAKREEG